MSKAGSTTVEEPSFEGTVFEGMDDAEIAYFAQDQQEFKEFMNKKGIKRGDRGRLWAKLGKWRDARQQESPPKRAARVSNRSQEVEGQGASAMIGSRHSSFLAGATEEPPRKAPANYFLSVPKTELKPNDHELKSDNFDEADFFAAVERLREKKEWVKPTKRITSLHTLLRKGSVYDTHAGLSISNILAPAPRRYSHHQTSRLGSWNAYPCPVACRPSSRLSTLGLPLPYATDRISNTTGQQALSFKLGLLRSVALLGVTVHPATHWTKIRSAVRSAVFWLLSSSPTVSAKSIISKPEESKSPVIAKQRFKSSSNTNGSLPNNLAST